MPVRDDQPGHNSRLLELNWDECTKYMLYIPFEDAIFERHNQLPIDLRTKITVRTRTLSRLQQGSLEDEQ